MLVEEQRREQWLALLQTPPAGTSDWFYNFCAEIFECTPYDDEIDDRKTHEIITEMLDSKYPNVRLTFAQVVSLRAQSHCGISPLIKAIRNALLKEENVVIRKHLVSALSYASKRPETKERALDAIANWVWHSGSTSSIEMLSVLKFTTNTKTDIVDIIRRAVAQCEASGQFQKAKRSNGEVMEETIMGSGNDQYEDRTKLIRRLHVFDGILAKELDAIHRSMIRLNRKRFSSLRECSKLGGNMLRLKNEQIAILRLSSKINEMIRVLGGSVTPKPFRAPTQSEARRSGWTPNTLKS
ncbi:hypothetical protein KKB44_02600 [Candidatus Micrarchaeota archaeon]|nr:hypothetical protein [Candidatus Micrarchaeota archaeon]